MKNPGCYIESWTYIKHKTLKGSRAKWLWMLGPQNTGGMVSLDLLLVPCNLNMELTKAATRNVRRFRLQMPPKKFLSVAGEPGKTQPCKTVNFCQMTVIVNSPKIKRWLYLTNLKQRPRAPHTSALSRQYQAVGKTHAKWVREG